MEKNRFFEYVNKYIDNFEMGDNPVSFENSIFLYAIYSLYRNTRNLKYYNFVYNYYDEVIDKLGNITGYDFDSYNTISLAFGIALVDLYEDTRELKFRAAMRKLMTQYGRSKRVEDVAISHNINSSHMFTCLDAYSSLVFFSKFVKLFGGRVGSRKDIETQITFVTNKLYDSYKNLYTEAYSIKEMPWTNSQNISKQAFLRSISFLFMLSTETYDLLKIQQSKTLFNKIYNQIMPYFGDDSFYFIIDSINPNNYIETSGNLFICYSLLKAKRIGLSRDRVSGEAILNYIYDLKFDYENLIDICNYFNIDSEEFDASDEFYFGLDILSNTKIGVASLILATNEYISYREIDDNSNNDFLKEIMSKK